MRDDAAAPAGAVSNGGGGGARISRANVHTKHPGRGPAPRGVPSCNLTHSSPHYCSKLQRIRMRSWLLCSAYSLVIALSCP